MTGGRLSTGSFIPPVKEKNPYFVKESSNWEVWRGPRTIESWIADFWTLRIQSQESLFASGRGYFLFLFLNKESCNLIFHFGPYFMGSRGIYLSSCCLDFNLKEDIIATLLWVKLSHFPIIFWDESSLKYIGKKLGIFINKVEPKGNILSCSWKRVEFNLEKGLPKALQINLDGWSHLQTLDYEQLSFKCNHCHIYGHFAKYFSQLLKRNSPLLLNNKLNSSKLRAGTKVHNTRLKDFSRGISQKEQ